MLTELESNYGSSSVNIDNSNDTGGKMVIKNINSS